MTTGSGKKRNRAWGVVSIALAAAVLLAVLALTASAARSTGGDWHRFTDADLSQGVNGTISYDDRLYASLGFGIEILPGEPDSAARLEAFLSGALGKIGERIYGAGLLYTMMVSISAALFLAEKFGQRPGRHTLAAALCPAGIYGVYLLCTTILFALAGVRFPAPPGAALFSLAAGLAALCGGGCALALLLRRARRRVLIAVLAIPAGLVLITTGMLSEGRLFAVPEVDSFDAVYASVPEEALDRMYYDEEKNVMVLDGTEYPPEREPNPERARGGLRIGLIVYELANPYSGNGLDMIRQFEGETEIPAAAPLLYLLKTAAWIVLPLCLRRKTGRVAG